MPQLNYDDGLLVTVTFSLSNPSANATTALTLPQGNTAVLVPDGMRAWPYFLIAHSNADLTAGTLTAKFTSGGSVVSNGPEPQLADTVQRKAAFVQPGDVGIDAGGLLGVSVVTDASYAPVTADVDVVAGFFLVPIPS